MTWLKRIGKGILTRTSDKKETKDGIWIQCKKCKKASRKKELQANLNVCLHCGSHGKCGSTEYFDFLFDDGYEELFANILAKDMLNFTDLKPYKLRLEKAQETTKLEDAMKVGVGKISGKNLVIACMDFSFIGGSMGSVVGEKISKSIDHCIKYKMPLLIISKSGGARMMEAAFSLMQMAKTASKLSLLAKAKIPYISLMTDPTTGGVSASYAMLGDINIAEPDALIAFAGPRVVKETIKRDLPEGFQKSEFLMERGFLDMIVKRHDLKETLSTLLTYFEN